MFHVATGRSNHIDAFQAGREAARSAQAEVVYRQGRHVRPGLALVFGDERYAQQRLLDGVTDVIGCNVALVGCSGNGQISSSGLEHGAVVVMLIWPGSRLAVCPVLTTGVGANPHAAGLALGRQIRARLPHAADVTTRTKWIGDHFVTIRPYTVLLFSDIAGSDHGLLSGATAALGPAFQLVGGVAAGALRLSDPCVYFNGAVLHDAAVGLAIVSRVPTAVGVCHECRNEQVATMTRRNGRGVFHGSVESLTQTFSPHIFGHQHQPAAIERYAEPFANGDHGVPHLPAPLHIQPVVKVNGAAAPNGPVPRNGCTEECNVEAARDAATYARNSLGNALPAAAMVFSSSISAGSGGASMGQKLAAVRSVLGESVPVIGFHTIGEPDALDQHTTHLTVPERHHQTCVVYVVGI